MVFALFFPRPLGQRAARVVLAPGNAWLGFVPQNRQAWERCPSEQSVFLLDFISLEDVDDATAAGAPWRQVHLMALDEWRVMIPRPLTHDQAERLVGDAASPGITLVFMPREESKPLVAQGCRNSFPWLVMGRRVSRYRCAETHIGIRLVLPTRPKSIATPQ